MNHETHVVRASPRGSAAGGRWLAGLALIGLLVTGARFASWPRVFTSEGILFTGNDAYYHALRTQRTVQRFPVVPARDSRMDYPAGAIVPWPPLFDLAVASAAMIAGGGEPSPRVVETTGAIFPVLPGLLTLLLCGWLAFRVGGRGVALRAVVVLGLLPAHVTFSSVGRLDQHVAEVLLLCWLLIACLAGARSEGGRAWRADIALGVGIAVAFWTWLGSALHLLFLVACVGGWFVVARSGDASAGRAARSLARGAISGAACLGASMFAFGRGDALLETSLVGLTGFHATTVLAASAFAALLWGASHRGWVTGRGRRFVACLLSAALVGGVTVFASPQMRDAVAHGVTALSKGSGWYRNIQEFDPLLFGGFRSLGSEIVTVLELFGLSLFLLPVAAVRLAQVSRGGGARGTAAFFVLVATAGFLGLAFYSQRFTAYVSVPLAIATALAWDRVERALASRVPVRPPVVRALVVAVCLAPCAAWYVDRLSSGPDPKAVALERTLAWMRDRVPDPGLEAVLAEWSFGHHVQYRAGRPVIVNPFGTDLGRGGMEDAARFFLSRNEAEVTTLFERRRVGVVLLTNPVTEAHFAHAFAPPGTPRVVDVTRDWPAPYEVRIAPGFEELIASRLYFRDGMVARGYGEALGRLRLVYESERFGGPPARDVFKVFEVVAGATLRVAAPPGERVDVRARLRTNRDREIYWISSRTADAAGTAVVRVPYATGSNGEVTVSPYEIAVGRRRASVSVTADDVRNGGSKVVRPGP